MKTGLSLINDIDKFVPAYGQAAFWWLGQLGFVVKLGMTVIYLDPFLSEVPGRNIPAPLNPLEITHADLVLGSHDHSDHIDRKIWPELSLSSPGAIFVVPELLKDSLREDLIIPENRFIGLDDGVTADVKGIKITGVAASHEFLDRDSGTGRYPYLGYVIEGNGCVIYHSGDTCVYDGLRAKLANWALDIMLIPINGRDGKRYRDGCAGNMTYQEAVDLAGSLKPGLVVPAHYEMFDFNGEDPYLFADYISAKYPGVEYLIANHGEMILKEAMA